jgi:hypothetical protein
MTLSVPVTWEVMGVKHDKVKKNRAKGRLRRKNCSSTALTTEANVMLGDTRCPPSTYSKKFLRVVFVS